MTRVTAIFGGSSDKDSPIYRDQNLQVNYVHDSRSYLHVDINLIFRCGGFPLLALTFPTPSMSNSIYTPTYPICIPLSIVFKLWENTQLVQSF